LIRSLKIFSFLSILIFIQSCGGISSIYNFNYPLTSEIAKAKSSALSVKIPKSWSAIEDNECKCTDLWLVKDDYSATLNFVTLNLDSVTTNNIRTDEINSLVQLSKAFVKAKYGNEFNTFSYLFGFDLSSFKNPAFSEEQEIRLIHLLDFKPSNKFLKLEDAGGIYFGEEKKGEEAGLTQSERDLSKKYLEEAGLTPGEQAIYIKYLKSIEVDRKEKFSLKGFTKAFQSNPDHYTEEEQELLRSVFDKIQKLKNIKYNLFEEQEETILKTLANLEEKARMFKEAELTPEEQKAIETYLEYKKTFKPWSKKTAWERITTGDDVPNYTPEEDKLRVSAVKKLISIKKGKEDYSI